MSSLFSPMATVMAAASSPAAPHRLSPWMLTLTGLLALQLGGCAVGPAYQRPTTAEVSSYKEAGIWVPATPADALERGSWWLLCADPVLNDLIARVEVSNQNVAAAVAAYAQARALVREQRSSLFPSVSLDAGDSRSRSGGTGGGSRISNNYQVSLGGSWEPDVRAGQRGRSGIGQTVGAGRAGGQLLLAAPA